MNAAAPDPPRPAHVRVPLVQIAGVSTLAEARLSALAGVHALGFTLGLPSGVHDGLTEDRARALIRALPPLVTPVLITYLPPDEAWALARRLGVLTVQLHDPPAAAALAAAGARAPELRVIAAVSVDGEGALARAAELAAAADALILDSVDPATFARGATGRTHDWMISARIVAAVPVPVMLAGGLTPDNVGAAIRAVRPYAVDVHTGVEHPDGRRDFARIAAFAAAVRRAAFDGSAAPSVAWPDAGDR